ncbi:MAG: lysophospholipid acyltransferase family protein [Candidatus Aureabacteria bacterium]|nr:lysophospholipid acyltransferase family protein [Candidatus Auribacterota bacterium]
MKAKKILTPQSTLLFARLVSGFIGLVGKTSRWRFEGEGTVWDLLRADRPAIFAFWHNRFLVMPYVYTAHFRQNRIAVIVSQSRDGALVGEFISRYGFQPVRGSTTRGGQAALLALARVIKAGWNAAVTPDGPRGPRYRAQPGIVTLASLTGAPIVPVSYASTRQAVFSRTWDQMRIPLPGGRIRVVFSPPLIVPPGLDGKAREEMAGILEEKLKECDRASAGA